MDGINYFKNPFFQAKKNFFLLVTKKYLSFLFLVLLGLFFFKYLYRFFIYIKLNLGVEKIFWYSVLQFLDIPEEILSISPFFSVLLIQIIIYSLFRKGTFQRFDLSGNDSFKLLYLINGIGIVSIILFLIIRENFAFGWKKNGSHLFQQYIRHSLRESSENKLLSLSEFVHLPSGEIVFFNKAIKLKNQLFLFNVVIDDINKRNSIITAREANIISNTITLKNGHHFFLNKNAPYKKGTKGVSVKQDTFQTVAFQEKKIYMGDLFHQYISNRGPSIYISSLQLLKQINIERMYGVRLGYKQSILLQRVLPFILFFLILVIKLFVYKYLKYSFTKRNMTFEAILSLFLMIGMNEILMLI